LLIYVDIICYFCTLYVELFDLLIANFQ